MRETSSGPVSFGQNRARWLLHTGLLLGRICLAKTWPEPNRILASFAQYVLSLLWKNGTKCEMGKLIAGQLPSARTEPDDSCTAAIFVLGDMVRESQCATLIQPGSKRNRPAITFPVFSSVPLSQRRPHIVQSRPGFDLVLADSVRFWPSWSGSEASRCARIIGPDSAKWTRPATSFLHPISFRSSKDSPDNIVRNRRGSDLVLGGYVRLRPNRSCPEANR